MKFIAFILDPSVSSPFDSSLADVPRNRDQYWIELVGNKPHE